MGSRAIRQTVIQNINAAGPGGGNTGRALYPQFARIANIKYFVPFNTASYNGLLMSVDAALRKFSARLSYTFLARIGYADDTDGGLTWNWLPMLQRNRAVAGFDRTHNLQFYGNYDLPFGHGKKFANSGFAAKLAGGWQVNWILSRTSGTPFTVGTSGTSVNAPGNTQTADQLIAEVGILGGHGVGQPYFDPNAFGPVTAVRFGIERPQSAARSRSLQPGRKPVPELQNDRAIHSAIPGGSRSAPPTRPSSPTRAQPSPR